MNVNELTLDVIKSYAEACRSLHDYIKLLQIDGYDLIVIPSRGAHPFLQAARAYDHRLRSEHESDFSVPRSRYPRELYLPFTADISRDQSITSSAIRHYWARVLAAIINNDKDDTALRFHDNVRAMAGTLALGGTLERGNSVGRFIFIDTVVSGRGISEIFTAFSACGLSGCHFILLVDEGGAGLKPEFLRAIQQREQTGQATTILVDKIFTEDEGPAMSGIWTVTMPDLTSAAQKVLGLVGANEVAATLYYWEVRRRDDHSNIDITMSNAILSNLLFSAVHEYDSVTKNILEQFQEHVSRAKLQRQSVTQAIAAPLIALNLPILSTDVSSSHVIRAFMDREKAEKLVRQFKVSNP